jgi:hypothetical protein
MLQYPERSSSAVDSCCHSSPNSLTQAPGLQRVRACRSCARRGAAPSCAATAASTGDLPDSCMVAAARAPQQQSSGSQLAHADNVNRTPSSPAGYRSSTLLYFTAATGQATSSRRDATWWITSNGSGARRPPSPPFPKLHMLHNTVESAERHQFLGRASEAQFESFHEQFNALFHKQHRNQPSSTAQWLRRSLADATLGAVQPSRASDFVLASCSFQLSFQHNQASFRPETSTIIFSTHDTIVTSSSSLYRSSLRFRPLSERGPLPCGSLLYCAALSSSRSRIFPLQ